MKFALIENKKTEAIKGAKGICPGCGSELIAKCGDVKLHHWAHKGNHNCDPWWENETLWHRLWKNKYPLEWQEVFSHDDQTGERHVADIRTTHDLVIEFQHSQISPQESVSREAFYKNMLWVVDGTRLKNDFKRLLRGKDNYFKATNIKGIYLVSFPEGCFPSAWLKSSVPVIFDFRGVESIYDLNDIRNNLFCLYPKKIGRESILITMSQNYLIEKTTNGEWSTLMSNINKLRQALQKEFEMQKRLQESMLVQRFMGASRYQNRRRRF